MNPGVAPFLMPPGVSHHTGAPPYRLAPGERALRVA